MNERRASRRTPDRRETVRTAPDVNEFGSIKGMRHAVCEFFGVSHDTTLDDLKTFFPNYTVEFTN